MFDDGKSSTMPSPSSTQGNHQPNSSINTPSSSGATNLTSVSSGSSFSNLVFRRIPAERTIPLRHLVLWPSISIEFQLVPSYDLSQDTIHTGAFLPSTPHIEQDPIGILTLAIQPYSNPSSLPVSLQDQDVHVQLHKFAVNPSCQGKSIGRQLLAYAIRLLREVYCGKRVLLHFDARANQQRFYQNCGMIILDDNTFVKYGPNGEGKGVEYVKMGNVI
ncbi:uncharacterized protein IL334_006737 [Kwoniella shivajii]|uniref:N-acetyltransferase domain-containing protein n=1 Tax=Kwoniella shivajii TaxID=564305 RepID=A0ABZ1D6S4_9TREE|nr:hypothetical protein IL334_006737 [Kwoniella shivajii]